MIYYLRGRNSLNLALKFAILLRIPCIAEMAGLMCGKPGRSVGCHIEGGEKLSYHEEEEVRYRCDTYDGFIRGKTVRKCINGSWTGSIPIIYHRLEIRSAYQSTTLPDLSNSLSIDGNSSTCISTEMQSEGFWMGMLNASFNINAIKVVFPRNIQVKVQVLVKEDKRSEIPCGNYSGSTGTDSGLLFICPPGAIGTSVIIQDLSKVLHRFVICEVTLYTLQASPCLRPDIPFNVNAHKTVGVHFTEYTFSCKSGYYLEGPQRILCNSYGIWQDKAPECKPSSCGKLPDIANGILIANSTTIGNTAWLICNEGYRPLSNDEITCLRTGEWTKPYPLCAPIQCDDKPKIPHGSAVLLTYSAFYGSPLKIECDEGFFPKGNISRMCELDGTWGDLDICVEITCLSHNDNEMTNGEWLQLNNSKSIKVLMCQQGYYIEGSPAITQCLPNGSWSYTTAVCRNYSDVKEHPEGWYSCIWNTCIVSPIRKSEGVSTSKLDTSEVMGIRGVEFIIASISGEAPVAGALDDNWSPTLILVTAIAAGAATAICVLCLAVSLQVLIKRRQSRSNTTVFHLGEVDSLSYRSGIKKHKPQESTNCTLDTYTEVIELRHKDHKTAPRKPRSALPHLPLDADPVYAQPFETTTAQHPMKKISTYSMGNKDDIYTAHIYAEPVDSRRPPSGTSNVSNSFTEAWFQAGTGKFRRKMSLPDCTSTFNDKVQHKSDDNFAAFYKLFSHPSTSSCLRPTSSEECQTELEPTKEIIFPELINNSIYLESSDRNISPENTERFQMIDNDIYLDNYFSHA